MCVANLMFDGKAEPPTHTPTQASVGACLIPPYMLVETIYGTATVCWALGKPQVLISVVMWFLGWVQGLWEQCPEARLGLEGRGVSWGREVDVARLARGAVAPCLPCPADLLSP